MLHGQRLLSVLQTLKRQLVISDFSYKLMMQIVKQLRTRFILCLYSAVNSYLILNNQFQEIFLNY